MLDITANLIISSINRGTKLMRKLLKVPPSLKRLKKLHQLPQHHLPNKLQLLIMPRSQQSCQVSSTAQISTRDSPLPTDRPEESHSHRSTTTATQISHLLNSRMDQLVHPMVPLSTAQTSMKDSPLPMERLKASHTHRLATTALLTINLLNSRMDQLVHPTVPLSTAQTSMRDSPLPMERLEASHTHRLDTTALPTINSCNQSKRTSHPTLPSSSTAQTSTSE